MRKSMYPDEVEAAFQRVLLKTGDYESYFVARIRPEIYDDVEKQIAEDVKHDQHISEAGRLAYGVLHFMVEVTGHDTYSLRDLAEIFELPSRQVRKLLRGLFERRYIGYIRRGLGAKNILYVVLDRKK